MVNSGELMGEEIGDFVHSSTKESKSLHDLFNDYGLRPATVNVLLQMGFTVNTLINMTDQEIDYVIKMMVESYNVELLVGERFGIKSAVRAERRFLLEETQRQRARLCSPTARKKRSDGLSEVDAILMEGLPSDSSCKSSQESLLACIQNCNVFPFVGENQPSVDNSYALTAFPEVSSYCRDEFDEKGKEMRKRKLMDENRERIPRDQALTLTQPTKFTRYTRNSLEYLLDLYEEAGKYLEEVQQLARERGSNSPPKYDHCTFSNL